MFRTDENLLFFTVKRDQFGSDHQHHLIIVFVKHQNQNQNYYRLVFYELKLPLPSADL